MVVAEPQVARRLAVRRTQAVREVALLALLPALVSLLMLWPALSGQGVLASTEMVAADPFVGNIAPGTAQSLSENPQLSDPVDQFIPWRLYARSELRAGRFPLWNPYNALGTHFQANYQSQVLSPFNILWLTLPPVWGIGFIAALKWTLMGLGTGLLLRRLGLGMPAAAFGGVAGQLMGPVVAWLQWPHSEALAWMPWLMFTALGWIDTRRIPWLVAFSAIVAAELLAGHIETAFYSFVLAGAFILAATGASAWSLRQKWGLLAGLAGSGVLGICMSAAQFLPLFEVLPSTWQWVTRSRSTTHLTALTPDAALTYLTPNGFGWANGWQGPLNWNEVNGYVGALTLLLAAWGLAAAFFQGHARTDVSDLPILRRVAAALSPRKPLFWALVVVTGVSMAYGIPPLSFLRHLPGFNSSLNFRLIAIAAFGLAVLAAMGLNRLVEDRTPGAEYRGRFYSLVTRYSLLVTSLLALLFLVGGVRSWYVSSVDGADYMQVWKMWAGVLFCAGAALIFARLSGLLNGRAVVVLATALVLLDLVRANWNFNATSPLNTFYPSNPMIDFLAQRGITERVAINGSYAQPNRLMTYRVADARYYDPAIDNRWRVYIRSMSPLSFSPSYPGYFIHLLLEQPNAAHLSMVGIRWLVTTSDIDPNSWQPVPDSGPIYRSTMTYNGFTVWENLYAKPYAYLAPDAALLADDNEGRQWLQDLKLESIDKVMLENATETSSFILGTGSPTEAEASSLRVVANIPGTIRVNLRTEQPRLLVVNEGWSPGWKAYIDGSDSRIYRANYVAQAVVVPAGEHEVIFSYDPPAFKAGLVISGVSLAVWLGLLVFAVWQWRRNSKLRVEAVGRPVA